MQHGIFNFVKFSQEFRFSKKINDDGELSNRVNTMNQLFFDGIDSF